MSAIPRLTRAVPVTGVVPVISALWAAGEGPLAALVAPVV
jgi:hypothetical protein